MFTYNTRGHNTTTMTFLSHNNYKKEAGEKREGGMQKGSVFKAFIRRCWVTSGYIDGKKNKIEQLCM